jgi:hypothetical protein
MEVGSILYSIIDEFGKEKIRSDLTSDISLSRHYIQKIMDECKNRIELHDESIVGLLCEALLHFMLTVCTLPSTRKIKINNTILDIIIPDAHTLKSSPAKSLLIQIVKETNGLNQSKISDFTKFQPEFKNLWIVSNKSLSIPYINYTVDFKEKAQRSLEKRNYRDIIVDIHNFLGETGNKGFRFFH